MREILPFETRFMRYVRTRRRGGEDEEDVRQETYVRVLMAAREVRPQRPEAFLFQTLRNLLTDIYRAERVRHVETGLDFGGLEALVEVITPERRVTGQQELAQLGRDLHALPARCAQVFWMRRVEDQPQKRVAQKLGIAEHTIEQHMRKARRRLLGS